MPHANVLRIGLAVRTRFLDELLLEALAEYPIATVLSLGCGLDTRPWRLELAPDLRWIEIDFNDVLDYKDRLMSSRRPGAAASVSRLISTIPHSARQCTKRQGTLPHS
jgi:O-methyltransferase involved in polyketide biosynthesis